MNTSMPVETELFEDQDVRCSPEPAVDQGADQFMFAYTLGLLPGRRREQISVWNMQRELARELSHSIDIDLFRTELLQHVIPRSGTPALVVGRSTHETTWISTNQLLEWVRLRAENTSLRHENGLLRQQLTALGASVRHDQDVVLASVVDDHAWDSSLQVFGFELPEVLAVLAETIDQSRSLLALGYDWDGEGTDGYTEETWHRTVDFLVRHAIALWERRRVTSENVEILPDVAGALAIDWRVGKRELLIRVPEDSKQDASYYGDDGSGRHKIKGTIDTSILNQWLIWWLAE